MRSLFLLPVTHRIVWPSRSPSAPVVATSRITNRARSVIYGVLRTVEPATANEGIPVSRNGRDGLYCGPITGRVQCLTLVNLRTNGLVVWVRRAVMLFFVLAFVCAASPVVAVTRWICEGRVCGISFGVPGSCCCAAINARKRDKDCAVTRQAAPAATGDTLACTDGCGCKGKTVHAGGELVVDKTKSAASVEPDWAAVPPTTPCFTPPFLSPVASAIYAGRGPPRAPSFVSLNLALRGPPAS